MNNWYMIVRIRRVSSDLPAGATQFLIIFGEKMWKIIWWLKMEMLFLYPMEILPKSKNIWKILFQRMNKTKRRNLWNMSTCYLIFYVVCFYIRNIILLILSWEGWLSTKNVIYVIENGLILGYKGDVMKRKIVWCAEWIDDNINHGIFDWIFEYFDNDFSFWLWQKTCYKYCTWVCDLSYKWFPDDWSHGDEKFF